MNKASSIRLVSTPAELEAIVPVLQQLRPQYSAASLVTHIIEQQETDGYQVACLFIDNKPACVAGFVINIKLAWGKHLYVDDLVTDEAFRSHGAGKVMVAWLKDHACQLGCRELHLDSGMHRKDAHRFYDREGFDRTGLHFVIAELPGRHE